MHICYYIAYWVVSEFVLLNKHGTSFLMTPDSAHCFAKSFWIDSSIVIDGGRECRDPHVPKFCSLEECFDADPAIANSQT
jgi:hypothetical protein